MNQNPSIENVIIIGSGPAAHTAAIYAARSMLKPLLFEGFMAGGVAAGGQLTTTTEIENFPGFPDPISGPELMSRMRQQSLQYGTRILTETVTEVDLSSRPFTATTSSGRYQSRSIILATGAIAKRLGITGEDKLWQQGISSCAVCDGALPRFRDGKLFLVGGGDVACEEAIYLSNFSSHVSMMLRRDEFRASPIMQDRVRAHPKISILWNTEAVEAIGEKDLTHVRTKNNKDNTEELREAQGLFYAIGHVPNTELLSGQIDCDADGYVLTHQNSTATDVPGFFACGDVQDKIYRQAVTAAGSGCMAALEAERFLSGE